MQKANSWYAAVMLMFAWPAISHARVVESTPNGFSVSFTAKVAAAPDAIWAQLVQPQLWWSKAHSWSGDASNFSLKAEPGGCFCEKLPSGGFAEHARVIYAAPGKILRLSGGFGPLQGEGIAGTLTMRIKPGEGGTSIVDFDYVVGGYARFDLNEMSAAVEGVIGEQHKRLTELF
jgi:hypothetical protein